MKDKTILLSTISGLTIGIALGLCITTSTSNTIKNRLVGLIPWLADSTNTTSDTSTYDTYSDINNRPKRIKRHRSKGTIITTTITQQQLLSACCDDNQNTYSTPPISFL